MKEKQKCLSCGRFMKSKEDTSGNVFVCENCDIIKVVI